MTQRQGEKRAPYPRVSLSMSMEKFSKKTVGKRGRVSEKVKERRKRGREGGSKRGMNIDPD